MSTAKSVSVCLLGTDVCANHHQHFLSLPIAAQVIGSPPAYVERKAATQSNVCLHRHMSVSRVALTRVGKGVWLVSQDAAECGDDYLQ